MVVFAGWLATRAEELRRALYPPVGIWIRIASVISVLLICVKLAEGNAVVGMVRRLLLLTLLGLAATWSGLAWLESSSGWFLASQVAIVAAGMTWIDTRLQRQPWFAESSLSRLYPQSLQVQAIWLTLFALGWTVLRGWLEGAKAAVEPEGNFTFRQKLNRLVSTPAMGVDHGAGMAAIVLLIGLTVYGVVPGVAQELMPRESAVRVVPAADAFLWHGIPHDTAHHGPTWLLGMLLALLCILVLAIRGIVRADVGVGVRFLDRAVLVVVALGAGCCRGVRLAVVFGRLLALGLDLCLDGTVAGRSGHSESGSLARV